MVAADPNNDNAITSADNNQLNALILGHSNSFTRKSWNWFNAYDVSNNLGFPTSPWADVIVSPGKEYTSLSYSDISNNIARFFDYRCTKIGEVKRTTANSWVCGSYSFKPKDSFITRTDNSNNNFLMKGMRFDLDVSTLNSTSDCVGFEIPIHIDDEKFDIKNVTVSGHFPINYYYNKDNNKLVVLMFDNKIKPYSIDVNQSLVHITLESKLEINNFDHQLFIHKDRNVEFVNSIADPIPMDLEFKISNISSPSLRAYVNQNYGQTEIHVWNKINQPLNVEILDLNGKILFTKNIQLASEHELISFDNKIPGIYIVHITSNEELLKLNYSYN